MAKYYGYARVSTGDQSDNSLENQLEYLRRKAEELNLDFESFSEKQSGKSFSSRKVLNELIKSVQEGDYIGFYDNSRLGRNTEESLSIIKQITEKGAYVQISGSTFDRNVPREKLLFTIESAISTFYREDQNLKSRVGIEQKKKNGEWIFTSRLFGYKVTFEGGQPKVNIVEEEAEVLRYIFSQYAKGDSIKSISDTLIKRGFKTRDGKDFHAATIRRYILKPIYKGYYSIEGPGGGKGQEKIKAEQANLVKSKYYPPIIEEDLWDAVNNSYRNIKRSHSRQFEYRFSYYELSSILRCGYCKLLGNAIGYVHNYHKQPNSDKVNQNYTNRAHLKGCNQEFHTFRAKILEQLFEKTFYLLFLKPVELGDFIKARREEIEDRTASVKDDIGRLNREIGIVEKKKQNYIEAIGNGIDLKLVKPELDKLNEEEKKLKESLHDFYNYVNEAEADIELLLEEYSENTLLQFIHSSPPNRRDIYKNLIDRAIVYNGQIIIRYTNAKVFVIPLEKNRGRTVQKLFKIKTYFMGHYQYTFQFDFVDNNLEMIDIPYNPEAWMGKEKYLEGYLGDNRQLLLDLKGKIKNLSMVPVQI